MKLIQSSCKKFYLVSNFVLVFVLLTAGCKSLSSTTTLNTGEIEATEFNGTKLTSISAQNNNALAGTQNITPATYTLTIDGLVDHP